MKEHKYKSTLEWHDGNGNGTTEYKAYSRNHKVSIQGKSKLLLSSDPAFMGDARLHNPEDLFLTSLSSCHMLWYLHLCSKNGITVIKYIDQAEGTMIEKPFSCGQFKEVQLNPVTTILEESKKEKALELHEEASKKCYIANSCNFPITHKPKIQLNK